MTFEEIKKEIYYLIGINADVYDILDIMDTMENKPYKSLSEIIVDYYNM